MPTDEEVAAKLASLPTFHEQWDYLYAYSSKVDHRVTLLPTVQNWIRAKAHEIRRWESGRMTPRA